MTSCYFPKFIQSFVVEKVHEKKKTYPLWDNAIFKKYSKGGKTPEKKMVF